MALFLVWVGILVIAILTTVVSIYGYRYVHRYERWAWIPMAIIFAILLVVAVLAHAHHTYAGIWSG